MSFVFKPIEPNHITVTPFYANKLWSIGATSIDFTDTSDYVIDSESSMSAYYGCYMTGTFYSGSAAEYKTTGGKYVREVWNSINNLFYKNYRISPWNSRQGEIGVETRNETPGMFVFSIPQKTLGLGIQPGSFKLNSGDGISCIDDGNGNILGAMTTVSESGLYNDTLKDFYYCSYKYYEAFKYSYDFLESYKNSTFKLYNHGNLGSGAQYNYTSSKGIAAPVFGPNYLNAVANNMLVARLGANTPFYFDFSYARGSTTGSRYIRISHSDKLNFGTNNDFSINLFTNTDGVTRTCTLLEKSGRHVVNTVPGITRTNQLFDTPDMNIGLGGDDIQDRIYIGAYPYRIEHLNTGHVKFSRSDGVNISSVTSSAALNTVLAWNMITCIKSGSQLQIWLDGALDATGTDTCLSTTKNDCDVFIGCSGDKITSGPVTLTSSQPSSSLSQFYGLLSGVDFFDRTLTSDDIAQLYSSQNGMGAYLGNYHNVYGNIFYDQGIIVFTGPAAGNSGAYYPNMSVPWSFSNDTYVQPPACYFESLEYRSRKLITTTEVICVVGSNELNMTTNPTILTKRNGVCNPGIGQQEGGVYNEDGECYSFVTGSDFSPYITTIGLCNDAGEVLVVGKLSTPLKKPNNCDVIFVVRWDN